MSFCYAKSFNKVLKYYSLREWYICIEAQKCPSFFKFYSPYKISLFTNLIFNIHNSGLLMLHYIHPKSKWKNKLLGEISQTTAPTRCLQLTELCILFVLSKWYNKQRKDTSLTLKPYKSLRLSVDLENDTRSSKSLICEFKHCPLKHYPLKAVARAAFCIRTIKPKNLQEQFLHRIVEIPLFPFFPPIFL